MTTTQMTRRPGAEIETRQPDLVAELFAAHEADIRTALADRVSVDQFRLGVVRAFQKSAGLVTDGISGPKTRAALHEALGKVKTKPHVSETAKIEHKPPVMSKKTPVSDTKPAPAKGPGGLAGVAVGGALAAGGYIYATWQDFTAWVASLFN